MSIVETRGMANAETGTLKYTSFTRGRGCPYAGAAGPKLLKAKSNGAKMKGGWINACLRIMLEGGRTDFQRLLAYWRQPRHFKG